ncbi:MULTISPECIES: hypothetical protein [Streptomycetaceae]|uniref:hypothetical protein n=1 Tax=Streptomycetaceae TaxID=2062 RepID=UPI00093958E1|nr:hypothetical protein [Streptomyces sp. CB02056]OKI05636.1 hypothetical protein AMK13_20065 [Streptomyces sp. CB02056]
MQNKPSPYVIGVLSVPFAKEAPATSYFFSKRGNLVYDWTADHGQRIGVLPDAFSALPEEYQAHPVAMAIPGSTSEAYFFHGDQVIHYDYKKKAVVLGPFPISKQGEAFAYLPDAYLGGVDAILPAGDTSAWFFKGDRCVHYDLVDEEVVDDQDGPIGDLWPGIDPAFAQGITSAMHHPGADQGYLFVANKYQPWTPSTGVLGAVKATSDGPWHGIELIAHGTMYVGTDTTVAEVDVDAGTEVPHDDYNAHDYRFAFNQARDHFVVTDGVGLSKSISTGFEDPAPNTWQEWFGDARAVRYADEEHVLVIDADSLQGYPTAIMCMVNSASGPGKKSSVKVDVDFTAGDMTLVQCWFTASRAWFIAVSKGDWYGQIIASCDISQGGKLDWAALNGDQPLLVFTTSAAVTADGAHGHVPTVGYLVGVTDDGEFTVSAIPSSHAPTSVSVSDDGTVVCVTNPEETLVSLDSGATWKTLAIGGYDVAVHPNGASFYVAHVGGIQAASTGFVPGEYAGPLGEPLPVQATVGEGGFALVPPWKS